jgi:DNA-directed RNA polymerase subunit M/transcription elongation factor TFIIS
MSTDQDNLREATKHIILCDKCGTRYVIIAPTREYSSPIDYPCPRIDYQKSYYDCKKCSYRNIFYWHRKHREDMVFQSA